jgi:hypothetical protein
MQARVLVPFLFRPIRKRMTLALPTKYRDAVEEDASVIANANQDVDLSINCTTNHNRRCVAALDNRSCITLMAICVLLPICIFGCKPEYPGPGKLDFAVNLVGGYRLTRMNSRDVEIAPSGGGNSTTPKISATVDAVAWDTRFIIAKRHDPSNANAVDYWILDTKVPVVYGPLTEEEFGKQCSLLGVAQTLKLRNVYELRP